MYFSCHLIKDLLFLSKGSVCFLIKCWEMKRALSSDLWLWIKLASLDLLRHTCLLFSAFWIVKLRRPKLVELVLFFRCYLRSIWIIVYNVLLIWLRYLNLMNLFTYIIFFIDCVCGDGALALFIFYFSLCIACNMIQF